MLKMEYKDIATGLQELNPEANEVKHPHIAIRIPPRRPSKPPKLYLTRRDAIDWHSFYPCNHEGICDDDTCGCASHNHFCEKTCACSDDCERRFWGCSCSATNVKCANNPKCTCIRNDRECDPDLCGTCGLDERPVGAKECGNMAIQQSRLKRTLLGNSEYGGFGLYMGEPARKNDFIGEYVGELVTKPECERRAVIYSENNAQYESGLNKGNLMHTMVKRDYLPFLRSGS